MSGKSFTDDLKVAVDGTVYHAPENEIFNISEIWAFLSVDEKGAEGVCGVGGMPLIAADLSRLISIEPMIPEMVKMAG